ncbi:MAG: class I SAM-dependent methyltransferase [Puniceicoccales bacterium]
MATDYNEIAQDYVELKMQPWRAAVEEYTLLRHLGNVAGEKVVDLACGQGFFTRKVKALGASDVLGVDLSRKMIQLAREEEVRAPLGIDYQVGDAMADGPREDFDLAMCAWLLTYAYNSAVLDSMCRGLARRLRSGGRLVTFTTNNDLYHYPSVDYTPYGFSIHLDAEVCDGAKIVWRFPTSNGYCDIENYYLPNASYRRALEAAGFREVTFHPLEISPESRSEYAPDYWDLLLKYQPAMVITAIRD